MCIFFLFFLWQFIAEMLKLLKFGLIQWTTFFDLLQRNDVHVRGCVIVAVASGEGQGHVAPPPWLLISLAFYVEWHDL